MATQMVSIKLPDEVYRRFEGMAAATQRPLEEVIVQTIRSNLPPALDDLPTEQRDLVADLQHLGDEALWAAAKQPLPAPTLRRQQRLLQKGEAGTLTSAEQDELVELRKATDRFVTRRSYALALLKWRGYTIPAAPAAL